MDKLIPLKKLLEITGIKKTTAYNKWNKNSRYYDPSYPKPLQTKGKLLFSQQDAQAYIENITARKNEF